MLVLTSSLIAAHPRAAAAFSCLYTVTPCKARRAPVIFVGEVTSLRGDRQGVEHRVRVVRAIRGVRGTTLTVRSPGEINGIRLEVGTRFVAYASEWTHELYADICRPVFPLQPGEPEPTAPPQDGHVYGRIARQDPDTFSLTPASGVRVWVDLPTGRVSAVSNPHGRFTLAGLPPGAHRVGVDSGHRREKAISEPFTLKTAADCVDTFISLHPAAR